MSDVFRSNVPQAGFSRRIILKVLTNEKRGGLKVATFDRSPFKLFSLNFSAKSVQALSCERLKTTQRTLFLSFAIKNCFPITLLRRSFIKKSRKLACHVVNWNIAIDSSPKLQISLEIIALFEKIYDGGPILTVVSNIGVDVSNNCLMWKVCRISTL
jgi:hypothetical protein